MLEKAAGAVGRLRSHSTSNVVSEKEAPDTWRTPCYLFYIISYTLAPAHCIVNAYAREQLALYYYEHSNTNMSDIILFFVGIIVGAMNGVAGGGMLIGFPLLIASGLSALSANATGYIASLPGQLASAVGYRERLRTVPRRYALLLVPCVVGAAIGTLILRNTDASSFERFVPLLILAAVGLLAFQPPLQRYLKRHLKARAAPPRIKPLTAMGLMLFPLAIYGGYFGPGFGFVLLAFLSFTRFNGLHTMNGLKNVMATAMLVTSIIALQGSSLIDWQAGLIMGAGSLIGGYFGARYIQKIPGTISRIIVISIGVIAALYLALR